MTRVIVVEYAFDTPLDDGARSQVERRLAVLEAADAETVRHAHRSAGVAFQTAWLAERD
jgi:hypothetical protein